MAWSTGAGGTRVPAKDSSASRSCRNTFIPFSDEWVGERKRAAPGSRIGETQPGETTERARARDHRRRPDSACEVRLGPRWKAKWARSALDERLGASPSGGRGVDLDLGSR